LGGFLAVLGFELGTSHTPPLESTFSHFCSGYFGYGISLFDQASLDLNPSVLDFLP
jgi:hypothetical protein